MSTVGAFAEYRSIPVSR